VNDNWSLRHTKWECRSPVVFIPKCRKKTIYGALRRRLGDVLRTLAEQKESRIEEGHLMPDHVHIMISNYSVAQVVGYIKGKSAIQSEEPRGATPQLRGAALPGPRILRRLWAETRLRFASTFGPRREDLWAEKLNLQ